MRHWKKINRALDSELESFDKFMTRRDIDGDRKESMTEIEVEKMSKILENPLPDRFIQEKLLDEHAKHSS